MYGENTHVSTTAGAHEPQKVVNIFSGSCAPDHSNLLPHLVIFVLLTVCLSVFQIVMGPSHHGT